MKSDFYLNSRVKTLGFCCACVLVAMCFGRGANAKNVPILNLFDPVANGLPGDTVFALYGDPLLNHQGQIAARVSMSSVSAPLISNQRSAIWTGAANDFGMHLQGGTQATPTGNFRLSSIENLSFSDSGAIQFNGAAYDLVTGEYVPNTSGLWTDRSGELELVVPKRPIPGGDGSSNFGYLGDPTRTRYSNSGYALFDSGRYITADEIGIRNSLWIDTPEGLVNIGKTYDPAPGMPEGYVFDDFHIRPTGGNSVNSNGEVMFFASIWDGGLPGTTGLWKYSNSTLELIFDTYNTLPPGMPDGLWPMVSSVNLSLNDAGRSIVAMRDSGLIENVFKHKGVWTDRSGEWENVAYSNRQAPGLAEGVNLNHFGDSRSGDAVPIINGNNKIAFYAYLKSDDVGLVDSSNDLVIYSDVRGQLEPILREGDDAPGYSDYRLNRPIGMNMNALDQLVIAGPAVNKNDESFFGFIWVAGPTGEILPILPPGHMINGKEVKNARLLHEGSSGGQDGHARNFNDFGQVLYTAHYADYTNEIVLHTPDLHYRSTTSSTFDDRYNWTLSTPPAYVHDVFIDPAAAGVTVTGPSEAMVVANLTLGSEAGAVTYRPTAGGVIESLGALSIHAEAVLDVSLLGALEPSLGETFRIFDFDTLDGVFGSIIGQTLDSGLILAANYLADGIEVTAAIVADFDLNQQVDVADLSNWAVNFGRTGVGFGQGDANQDGQVDVSDLSLWATHFGRSASDYVEPMTLGASAVTVPEPATAALFAMIACLGMRRVKR